MMIYIICINIIALISVAIYIQKGEALKKKTLFLILVLTCVYSIACAAEGEEVWDIDSGYGSILSSPTVSGGYVYVGSQYLGSSTPNNKLHCLNATTGDKVWDYPTGDGVTSSPAVSVGYVYVGSDDNKVYCLNAATGAYVWDYTTGGSVASSPAVSGGYVYVGSDDNKVYCLNAATGDKVWEYATYETAGYFNSSPAVSGGRVYVGSGDIYCLKAADGDTGSWPMFQYNPERTGAN